MKQPSSVPPKNNTINLPLVEVDPVSTADGSSLLLLSIFYIFSQRKQKFLVHSAFKAVFSLSKKIF